MYNIAILTHHSAKIMKLFPEICLSRSVTPSNLKLNPSMMGNKIHDSLFLKPKFVYRSQLSMSGEITLYFLYVIIKCLIVNCKFILIKAMDKWYENTMQS